MKRVFLLAATALTLAGNARAQEITCRGDITSVQGEGLVARTHRFEVPDVTGPDVAAIIEQCRKIALERQNVAARKNPGGNFRQNSDMNLQCVQGSDRFPLRRTIRTGR